MQETSVTRALIIRLKGYLEHPRIPGCSVQAWGLSLYVRGLGLEVTRTRVPTRVTLTMKATGFLRRLTYTKQPYTTLKELLLKVTLRLNV